MLDSKRLVERTAVQPVEQATRKVPPHVKPDPVVQNIEQAEAASTAAAGSARGAAVTAVERVLDILEAFQKVQRPLSLTDLAEITRIPKSSCHAIVGTLTARGYLYSLTRPRALYPTRRFFDIAREIHEHDPFVEGVMPMLERLRDSSRETVILGKRQGDSVIYLQVVESPHPIRYSARPGEFKPLHSSSIGKALLGSLKEAELRAQLAGLKLPAVTATTLTDPDALIRDILDSHLRGYFVTRGENVADVWAVSAFLTVHSETLAVAIAGPRHRMERNIIECAQLLVATCSFISRQWSRP
jgi:IclR family transcriptional regulator, acetate operon repressor